jgi:hypothetical protein
MEIFGGEFLGSIFEDFIRLRVFMYWGDYFGDFLDYIDTFFKILPPLFFLFSIK